MTEVQPKGVGMARVFRWVWGIAVLLSCGWIVYGLSVTGAAVTQVAAQATVTVQVVKNAAGTPVATIDPKLIQTAQAAGAAIGGGVGIVFFLCTGGPLLLIFGVLYWRNGVAIRNARQHAEIVNASQRG